MASAAPIERLMQTLRSLAAQSRAPDEILVCRLELTPDSACLIEAALSKTAARQIIVDAIQPGAGPQRQQIFDICKTEYVLFIDDDVDLDPDCIARLEEALDNNAVLGGVCACIRNQNYRPPGRLYRMLLRAFDFPREGSLSGLCRGPIVNFLPDLNSGEADLQPMEWLNLTCTIYRRSVLPERLFDGIVGKYSLMEDVALSLRVARSCDLAACRSATIFHDSKSQDYKSNAFRRQIMEVRNRAYIMRYVLHDFGLRRHLQLFLLSAIFTVSIWRMAGRWQDKMLHVVARWRYHLGLYAPWVR